MKNWYCLHIVLLINICAPSITQAQQVDLRKLRIPVLFSGDSVTAYRYPMVLYHNEIFYW